MDNSYEVVERLKNGLRPCIKSREHANYIRRVLALELGSCTGTGQLQRPLAHADSQNEAYVEGKSKESLRGVHKEYIEALRSNIRARHKFALIPYDTRSPDIRTSGIDAPTANAPMVENQIALQNLQIKLSNLEILETYLVRLLGKPAGNYDFLGKDQLSAVPPLPSTAADKAPTVAVHEQPDLRSQLKQLERTVLRQKLLLKREEKQLLQARARCTVKPNLVSNGARLQALDATRKALISWIENELAKASAENDEGREPNRNNFSAVDGSILTKQSQIIQEKYTAYSSARKELLALVALEIRPPVTSESHSPSPVQVAEQAHHTLVDQRYTSYADELVSLWQKQNTSAVEKSHIANVLGDKNRQISNSLARLAVDSRLLSTYTMKDSTRRRSGIPEITSASTSSRPEAARRIKPWLFATDAAKISMLEHVTESVERGQVALESTIQALEETDALLGQENQGIDGDLLDNRRESLGTSNKQYLSPRKRAQNQTRVDPWARIHGNLGLIGNG